MWVRGPTGWVFTGGQFVREDRLAEYLQVDSLWERPNWLSVHRWTVCERGPTGWVFTGGQCERDPTGWVFTGGQFVRETQLVECSQVDSLWERLDWLSVHRWTVYETGPTGRVFTVYVQSFRRPWTINCLGCSKGMVDKWNVTNVNTKPDMVIKTILFWGLQKIYSSHSWLLFPQQNAPNHPNTFTVPESKPTWSLRHKTISTVHHATQINL